VPAARIRALQDGLAATLKDPAYLSECVRQNLECSDPTSGAELRKILEDAYGAPADLVAKIRELNSSN
jgi:hypothetical protein